MIRAHLIDLHVVAVQFRRQTPGLERLPLPVELRDAALELHAQPHVLVLIEARRENSRRHLRLEQRHVVLGDGARPGIEFSQNLLAEARAGLK